MGKYQGYEKYKDSRVEWLGAIPEHWQKKRFKFYVNLINNKIEAQNSNLSYMGLEHIESWTGKRIEDENACSEGIGSHFLPNDVLFGKLRPYLAKVYLSEIEGLASTEALVLRCKNNIFPKYLKYYVLSRDFINIVDSSTFGAKMPRASWDFIGNLFFTLPILDEQKAIAHFLDYKTKQIDDLIKKKKTLIEKLDEKRTALISHAVTKGLDPNVPMKDSGIEWLGEIPEHWKLARIKYYADCFNGSTPLTTNPDYWDNGEIPWLSSGKVNDEIVTQPSAYISLQALKECSLRIVPKGSVIVGIVGQGKTRGLSAYLGINTTINQNMVAIVPYKNLEGKFLHLFLQQAYTSIRNLGRGANQPALDTGLINRFSLVIPPISEQKMIVDYFCKKDSEFFTAVEKIKEAIERLKEYRTALITNAVTGKIDVRQVPIP